MEISLLATFAVIALLVFKSVKIVPQQEAWLIETLGKFNTVLQPGLSIIIPFVQKVAYRHTLKEEAIDISAQTAISKDNVSLLIDGVLYVKIIDPVAASYGVNNPYYAISQLAQTTMRSEIGKLLLDRTFEEREALNIAIVESINGAAKQWGIQCMRYEIKDIQPPESILKAMELQVAADRKKRAKILDSEGTKESDINIAQGQKAQKVLESEADCTYQINKAKGEAEAILSVSKSTADSVKMLAQALNGEGGDKAISFKVAEQFVSAFESLAKNSNTILLPSNLSEPTSFITQALSIYDGIKSTQSKTKNISKKIENHGSKLKT